MARHAQARTRLGSATRRLRRARRARPPSGSPSSSVDRDVRLGLHAACSCARGSARVYDVRRQSVVHRAGRTAPRRARRRRRRPAPRRPDRRLAGCTLDREPGRRPREPLLEPRRAARRRPAAHRLGGHARTGRSVNSSRCSAELGVSGASAPTRARACEIGARVAATYSRRRSSPASSRRLARAVPRRSRGRLVRRRHGSVARRGRGTAAPPGRSPPTRSQPKGTQTTGNSSPLLVCTVTTCTAAASVSSRRLSRSGSASPRPRAIRRRSQVISAGEAEALGHRGLACSTSAMCRRSVSCAPRRVRRSSRGRPPRAPRRPPRTARRRRARPAHRAQLAQLLGRAGRGRAPRRCRAAAASRRPRGRAPGAGPGRSRCGCSSASSSTSQSRAAGVSNTLLVPAARTGTPTATQRVADLLGLPLVRTSTAMSPGSTGRGAASVSPHTESRDCEPGRPPPAARSPATARRAAAAERHPVPVGGQALRAAAAGSARAPGRCRGELGVRRGRRHRVRR